MAALIVSRQIESVARNSEPSVSEIQTQTGAFEEDGSISEEVARFPKILRSWFGSAQLRF